LDSFYSDLFEPLFLRSRSDNTRRLYRTSIRTFSKYLQRPACLSDLNDLTVNRFLDWYRRIPRSPYSANKERSNLLAIWRFACRKRFLEEWPDVRADVEPDRIPQAWTADQIAKLLACCERLTGRIGHIPASTWWRTLHLVCWDTGERIGAIRDLQWHHVDLVAKHILVPAELRKGKRRDRLYRIADDTAAALRSMQRTADSCVFPWPYCRTYLWNRYSLLLIAAGLPHDRHSKFHRIRRTVATYYEAAGGNATELLGHSSRSVTLAYLDPRILPPQHAADLLFRPTGLPDDP
jgi:integrase